MSGILLSISGIFLRISGLLLRISGIFLRISGILFRTSGILFRTSGILLRISGILLRIFIVHCFFRSVDTRTSPEIARSQKIESLIKRVVENKTRARLRQGETALPYPIRFLVFYEYFF
jgi:hypothetical protein